MPFLSIYPKTLKNSHFYAIILLDKLEFDGGYNLWDYSIYLKRKMSSLK